MVIGAIIQGLAQHGKSCANYAPRRYADRLQWACTSLPVSSSALVFPFVS